MVTTLPGEPSDSIAQWIDLAELATGLDTRALRAGDSLLVRTCNTSYVLRLEDPATGSVVASSDGAHVGDETETRLLGASLSGRGTAVKLGWILVGFKIVLRLPRGVLLTSRVRHVLVNGVPLPRVDGVH